MNGTLGYTTRNHPAIDGLTLTRALGGVIVPEIKGSYRLSAESTNGKDAMTV